MVDGTIEAGQTHGRPVPVQLCRTAQRRLPAMEPQWQSYERRRDSLTAKQCTGTGEASTAEEEHVQEALHGLCSCKRPKSSCRGA